MSKIHLIPIHLNELKPLIQFAFQHDPELLTTYSLLKTEDHTPTLEESVEKNYETILEAVNSPVYGNDVGLYRIERRDNDELLDIGFTVMVQNSAPPHMLFSFGINIRHRSRKNTTQWLQKVKDLFGKYIGVTLHKNNSRVIDFFVKNGFTKKDNEVDINYVTLLSNYQEFSKGKTKAHESWQRV